MDIDTVVRALRCVQEKHRNDRLLTFQTDVSAMARDAADLIESLQAQLAASQRRADAAVEDMKKVIDAVREEHSDETCCFACKFDCDTSITWTGDHACECPGFERGDCFEWRGGGK